MPNYSITINSRFRPFSYQEMLAPVLASTQAQQQLEETYANLATQAELAGSKANEQTDPVAYARYKAYSDELSGLAERLAKNGLTPEDRRSMFNMRARYAKDIVPIETAYATRKAQAEQQQAARLQNPTLLLGRDAATTSLDKYIENPNLGYDSYSGALLTQQVSTAVANMAKTDEGRTQLHQLLPMQYETIRRRGFKPEEVMEAIMNSPNANQILTGVVENVMDASGIKNWANERTLADAYNYARMGLYSGIGETVYGSVTDQAGLAKYQSDLAEQRAVNAFNRQVAYLEGQAGTNNARVNPLPLRSQEELSRNQKQIDDYVKAGFFEKDAKGNYIMTHKGFEEMRRMVSKGGVKSVDDDYTSYPFGAPGKSEKVHSDLYNFMTRLNGGKPILDKNGKALPGWGPGRAGALFSSHINNSQEGSYDTYHTTEYDRQLDPTYGGKVMEQIKSNMGSRGLTAVDFDGKKGWKDTKKLTSKDLDGYHVSNIRYSKYGNTAILQKDGEDPIRIKLPKGIHIAAEENIQAAIANVDEWTEIINSGKRPKVTADGRIQRDARGNIVYTNTPLTAEDLSIFQRNQYDALNSLGAYGSQLVVPSTTENETYKPFGF